MDIVDRLRNQPEYWSDGGRFDAANEIDRLQFEFERADESAKRLGAKWKEQGVEIERLRSDLAHLRRATISDRREITRLTAALSVEREHCAKIAENPGFIQAQDTEWDEGVNFAKRYIAAAIRKLR